MRCRLLSLWLLASLASSHAAESPPVYLNNGSLEEQLKNLAAAHPRALRIKVLANTLKNNPVWLAELGTATDAERATQPAMLLVAGIEGNDLAGSSSAIGWISHLLRSDDERIRKLLDSTTLFVVPRLNPDAATSFFETPKIERAATHRPADDDHDGLVDEDGPEDLNGDGLITWMRIQDADGDYILDSSDPRLLLKADRAKGEKGGWRYLVEGRDNDGDEEWNEDGSGGVNLNRNFSYGYKFFTPASGQHPMSEIETRALADFIVEHPNIGIVFTFGAADNLIQTPEGKEERSNRPPTSLQKDDLPYYRELGKAWRDTLGLKKELKGATEAGTFSDWMYFHRGRLSLAARAWSPALQIELDKAEAGIEPAKSGEKKEPGDDKKPSEAAESPQKSEDKTKRDPDTRNEEERSLLKWLDRHAPGAFLPWKEFNHPDFSGKKVEVGGFAPFARTNPPEKLLAPVIAKHVDFLTELAGKLPRVAIRRAEAKHLGNSIFELTIEIENTGYLPTSLAQGRVTREVLPTRVVLDLPEPAILAGNKRVSFDTIEGSGGKREVRYIIHGKGHDQVQVNVVSALGGTLRQPVPLKQNN